MKLLQLVSFLVLSTLVITGCSGGGRAQVAGAQCPANHKPIATDSAQKLWQKGQNENLPLGTYNYQGADMVYTEKGPEGLIIHVQDLPERNGTFKASINCVRNAAEIGNKPIAGSTSLASKILAKANIPAEVEVKELSFKVTDDRLLAESKALEKTDSVEKAYEGKSEALFMIENPNKVDYEIRSVFSDNSGDYVVSVRFKRVN